jgi:hypothetical protein
VQNDIAVSKLGLNTGESHWNLAGPNTYCTQYSMHSQIYNEAVRFSDGSYWSTSAVVGSAAMAATPTR